MAITITKTGGNGQSAKLNQLYANNLQVQVMDNATIPPTPVTGGTVSFQNINNLVTQPAAPFNGAGSQSGECGPGGYASTSIKPRANGVAGKVTIRCWGFGAETNFTLTNKTPSGSPVAEGIELTVGDNQTVLQGAGPSVTPVVKVTDQYDAAFAGASVTFTLPSSGPSGIFTGTGTTSSTGTSDAGGLVPMPAFTANSQLGPWIAGARLTADATVNVDIHFSTVPSSGTEVCTAALVPPTLASLPFAGNAYSWINIANWTSAGGNMTVFPTPDSSHSDYAVASGLAAALAAIPNAAEITQLRYSQSYRAQTNGSTLSAFFENTSFASPQITSQRNFNASISGSFATDTFTWTAFTTPNPGSKLYGSDVKSPNFRFKLFSSVVTPSGGQMDVRLLTITVCYIEPATGSGAGALAFCEI
jgi:hypothetical protein